MAEAGPKDLLTLVLRSRKALDHTQTLCLRADTLAKESTAVALDLVAVDAKVRWVAEVIAEQFKLVNNVAKGLTQQRLKLEQEEWDVKRKERSWALDALLESFGKQLVPPSFYETSSGSSLFGSQHSPFTNDAMEPIAKGDPIAKPHSNRSKWRSLRDFVDEPAIEEALERMESDRNALEDLLESTSSQTQNLDERVQAIKASLPNIKSSVLPSVQEWLKTQEADLGRMAQLLEDVTHHFDQMQSALADHDAGEIVSEEDMEVLEGDTELLPGIIMETEQSLEKIKAISVQLKEARDSWNAQFNSQKAATTALESLGGEIAELAEHHRMIELEAAQLQGVLQNHLTALGELHSTYIKYRAAYGNLVQEMDRRRRYRDAVEEIIRGMNTQLHAVRAEEMSHREQFVKTEGHFLPEDLCPFVGEMPTIFEVTSASEEVAVAVDSRYVKEIQDFIAKK